MHMLCDGLCVTGYVMGLCAVICISNNDGGGTLLVKKSGIDVPLLKEMRLC
jgi:hypothetical protein